MDEYALFLSNARRGVETSVSGHFNNEFIHCMGSPIRSEIWAVLAPGNPKLAAYFAYQDACVDYAGGEGVYGEVLLASLESMTLTDSNLMYITKKALTFIPKNCVTDKAVRDIISTTEKTAWPYLPAYHRPCPDFKTKTSGGVHKIKISVSSEGVSEPFEVAFQAVDLTDVFEVGKSLLQEELYMEINA